MAAKGFWAKLGDSLKDLKEEMLRNSVASSGPSKGSCCHVPEEELERRRQEALERQRIAQQKRPKP